MTLENPAVSYGGTANRDSSGPMSWSSPTGPDVLAGAHPQSDAERVALTVDYRVDLAETLDFIAAVCEFVDASDF